MQNPTLKYFADKHKDIFAIVIEDRLIVKINPHENNKEAWYLNVTADPAYIKVTKGFLKQISQNIFLKRTEHIPEIYKDIIGSVMFTQRIASIFEKQK